MGTYIVRRILIMIPMLFCITIMVFLIMHAAPGNAFSAMINPRITDFTEIKKNMIAAAGLNRPLAWQYIHWLKLFLTGNWGTSFQYHEPVIDLIGPALSNTALLGIMAEVMILIVGIPIGIVQARKPYSSFDNSMSLVMFVLYSVPYYIVALFMIYFFAITLPIFPSQGAFGSGPLAGTFIDHVYHAFLPALSIAVTSATVYSRYTRGSMLDVSRRDYVRTAFAKGLTEKKVFSKHVFRNGMIPIVTQFGFDIGYLVQGAIILEALFSYQGMGYLTVSAVESRDYPVIMATAVLFAIMVLLGNLLADILYAIVDPRIRYN